MFSPQFKTFLVSIFFFVVLFLYTTNAESSVVYEEGFKLCITTPVKDSNEDGCWDGKGKYGIPFKLWLQKIDKDAIFVKASTPSSGQGVAKIFYKKVK